MQWYLAVHQAPAGPLAKATWRCGEKNIDALQLNGSDLLPPLPVTFEEAIDKLKSWNTLLIEPDGSLVWASPDWRIDAQLQDGRNGLQYVEIRTTAPRPWNEQLLTAFGHPSHRFVIQLIHEGVFLDVGTWLELLDAEVVH
jgi:hypothetical protein